MAGTVASSLLFGAGCDEAVTSKEPYSASAVGGAGSSMLGDLTGNPLLSLNGRMLTEDARQQQIEQMQRQRQEHILRQQTIPEERTIDGIKMLTVVDYNRDGKFTALEDRWDIREDRKTFFDNMYILASVSQREYGGKIIGVIIRDLEGKEIGKNMEQVDSGTSKGYTFIGQFSAEKLRMLHSEQSGTTISGTRRYLIDFYICTPTADGGFDGKCFGERLITVNYDEEFPLSLTKNWRTFKENDN